MTNPSAGLFKNFLTLLLGGQINPTTDQLRAILLTGDFALDLENQQYYSDVNSFEVDGEGYSESGIVLNNVALDSTNIGHVLISCDDAIWNGPTTIQALYCVVYDATVANQPLISSFDFGNIQATIGNANSDYRVPLSLSGIVDLWYQADVYEQPGGT
jgi:hypothetical protein